MKEIKLDRLTLDHFKGCRHLELTFQGRSATIYGDNATGKSTVYDGLYWLLFDKDSQGRSGAAVKPLGPDGQVLDHEAVTGVEAVFLVDGQTVRLRKELREKWSARRGGREKSYDGNMAGYFVDGVPCKRYEFEEAVRRIVDETVFRLLTSTTYFCAGVKWQDRRALLFDLCGVADDQTVMGMDEQFGPLAEACGGKPVEDLRKRLAAERKSYVTTRDTIPIRLDEARKTVAQLEGVDYDVLRRERGQREEERDKLRAELLALEHNTLLDARRNELKGAQLELQELDGANRRYREEQSRAGERERLQRELERQREALTRAKREQMQEEDLIVRQDQEIERYRGLWRAISRERFQGSSCPTCGRPLPEENQEEARKAWETAKEERLADVVERSQELKNVAAGARERLEMAGDRERESLAGIAALEAQLAALPTEGQVADLEDYQPRRAALEGQISRLEREIGQLSGESATIRKQVEGRIQTLEEEIRAISGSIAGEAVLEQARRREEQLRADAREAAAHLEELDSLLSLCEAFTRFKAQYIDERVNSQFVRVSWRLFQEQANGGVADCCDAMVDGVPYGDLNNGAKINAGLDVIGVMSRHFGVAVPLFIDNAESVTRLWRPETQVIRLVVSKQDKELRVVYED